MNALNYFDGQALFSGGDARFLQAVYETKRSSGVLSTSIGRLSDGTRAVQVRCEAWLAAAAA